ncbi:hypothetical protein BGW38_005003, partial [Lunasporangiospora selenospora]
MGYIRQPVYACLTCNPNPTEEAGFCYSCSISCHGEHNLVELFTKRHFRCDCGTEKFKDTPCTLDPKPKGSVNELNQYNHNYLGRFCWCNVLYDPLKEESTMLQCVVCEDWFHDTCIGINPHQDDFDDFICRNCTKSHPFLRRYAQNTLFMIGISEKDGGPKAVTMIDCSKSKDKERKRSDEKGTSGAKQEEEVLIDIMSTTETKESTSKEKTVESEGIKDGTEDSVHAKRSLEDLTESTDNVDGEAEPKKKIKLESKMSSETTETVNLTTTSVTTTVTTTTVAGETSEECQLERQPIDAYPDLEVSLFATEGWRDLLCRCSDCVTLYTKEGVSFILGEDPIYEDEDDEDAETSILEGGMKKLSEMDRVEMMDGMLAYNKMRDEIRRFLVPFSEQGKVVTASDVQAFFSAKMEKR